VLTCRECREHLYPEDPSIPTGKYHHSTCAYFCSKPDYYREIERIKEVSKEEPTEVIHRHINYNSSLSRKEYGEIEQIKRKSIYLDKKVNEYIDKKRQSYNKTIVYKR